MFAGFYALFAGFLLVAIWGLILSPFLYAILNRLHIKAPLD
jgi:predicted PurR-regulated permease PerM